ncbi:hypothetical protein GCM10009850_096170 [Nonomuraea monospora]|uniref:Zinc-ribbon domain-containing protein n=1 Tax=Nonomuraea monospora TaxID=568818 RepID=A0ABP5PR92_9ACTN
MLQEMRLFWDDISAQRRRRVAAQVASARQRRDEIIAYWNHHKVVVQEQWKARPPGRGSVTVADIPEVAAQWHPANPGTPHQVLASHQGRRGEASPFRWLCPLNQGHPSWPAWPKDRVQAGTACPQCRHPLSLADIPALAEQYRGALPPKEIAFASHDLVEWECYTWAVVPATGQWRKVTHRFSAVIKERSLQGDACLVCAGYVIDDSNSLESWFPEIAAELDDESIDPATLPTSRHNASRRVGARPEVWTPVVMRRAAPYRWSAARSHSG